jgi:Uri superfamily endonuclease
VKAQLGTPASNIIPDQGRDGSIQGQMRRVSLARRHGLTCALDLPGQPGTYVLVLRCTAGRIIRVGRLGKGRLLPGYYVYVGSALGPGGLRARIAHHLRPAGRPHWHMDFLRVHMRVDRIWYCCGRVRLEHKWAQALEAAAGRSASFPRFGASDCNCHSHLYFFKRRPSRTSLERSFQTSLK